MSGSAREALLTRNASRLAQVYVHESGVPGTPAVVFLHGSAASGGMWRNHMARLAGYHCLAPDLPGFGRSNGMRCYSRAETADLVAELIRARVPAGRASIVGLSWGGSVCHALLERHAGLVDRAIIDGCGGLPWRWTYPFLGALFALSPFIHARPVVEAISRIVGGMDEAGKADIRATTPQAFRRSFAEGFTVKLTAAEISAACPTLLVCGEAETAVRPSNAALAALMSHAVARYVPGTGHGWLGFRPELHLEVVEAWLAGSTLPAGLSIERTPWPEGEVRRLVGGFA